MIHRPAAEVLKLLEPFQPARVISIKGDVTLGSFFFDLKGQFIHKNSVRRNTAFLLAFLQPDLSGRPPSATSRWAPRGPATLHGARKNTGTRKTPQSQDAFIQRLKKGKNCRLLILLIFLANITADVKAMANLLCGSYDKVGFVV